MKRQVLLTGLTQEQATKAKVQAERLGIFRNNLSITVECYGENEYEIFVYGGNKAILNDLEWFCLGVVA